MVYIIYMILKNEDIIIVVKFYEVILDSLSDIIHKKAIFYLIPSILY